MEQKSKSIGTTVYLVTQMDALRALKVQTKLIRLLGKGALPLLDTKISAKEKLAALIPKLMESFDDELVNSLVLDLFSKGVFTQDNGVPKVVDFSTHFAGKPFEMWKVVGFIMEVNFNMGELSKSDLPI
ncbi:MAG: hypothetical protein DRH26_18210, partial [Deltaproteobacteria bacterium]